MVAVLGAAARYGRVILVLGLLAGIALPGLAAVLARHLAEIAALLMFLAALRIGARAALGSVAEVGETLRMVAVQQVALPVGLALMFLGLGWGGPLATALILMASGAPISGAPNLTLLCGGDPAPSLRHYVAATVALPLTIMPGFWLWPAFGEMGEVLAAALRLVAILAVAGGTAFWLRARFLPAPRPDTVAAIDGLASLAMAFAVIGLMAAFVPALIERPGTLLLTLAAAFAANYGLQAATYAATAPAPAATAFAIGAGNRNIMLFLAVLPPAVTDELLVFVACYQIPMYLTPLLMRRLYARPARALARP
ncbi:hypothetical protein GI374_07115 [Paracoccus sp. S-4012]|uniref:hypothetical protein n=1 Tax=Paracoccus sp. S-4012 TaxID=2665648 RepID=UPI0012AFA3BC|nr:hypothetical protein [Paracoccus sp. S-4012]MRX50218.1 hypothetical protein [Paracoccus sp. S-4012]